MVYVITYDLCRPHQDYHGLHASIRDLGGWCHGVESTWFVSTNLNATQIRNALLPHIDSNDRLVVARVGGEAAWMGIVPECANWLQQYL